MKRISTKEWQKLFDLIPVIATIKSFGKSSVTKKHPDGSYSFPYIKEADVVLRFRKAVSDLSIMQPFDWPNWEEGRNMLNNPDSNFNSLDTETLCKLITTIIRMDRFEEGNLVSCFEKGIVLKILEALKKNITA